MRLWMIWAVLAILWALQAGAALLIHHYKPAGVMFAMAFLFAVIGGVVRRRLRSQTGPGVR